MPQSDSSILQGTLDLMVLKTLEHLGPQHGYGIALRIEQVGERALIVNQGTIYLCLVRLVQKKWIKAEWGVSDNNRKAKFYSLTRAGRKQLQAETANWERVAGVMGRVLNPQTGALTGFWSENTSQTGRFMAGAELKKFIDEDEVRTRKMYEEEGWLVN